jgi:single-stranded DNA-binding protein
VEIVANNFRMLGGRGEGGMAAGAGAGAGMGEAEPQAAAAAAGAEEMPSTEISDEDIPF